MSHSQPHFWGHFNLICYVLLQFIALCNVTGADTDVGAPSPKMDNPLLVIVGPASFHVTVVNILARRAKIPIQPQNRKQSTQLEQKAKRGCSAIDTASY